VPLPKFSSRYPDVREVFDYALANGGARYTLDTPGKAVHWRARAYAFRKVLWGEINASGGPPQPTPYDAVKITIDGSTCIIHVETASGRGKLEPLVETKPPQGLTLNTPEEDLDSAAAEFAKRLGIEL